MAEEKLSVAKQFALAIGATRTLVILIGRAIMRGLVFGAVVAITVTAAHGFYEWVFMLYHAHYVSAISLGIVAGIIRLSKREKTWRMNRKISQSDGDSRNSSASTKEIAIN